MSEKYLNDNKIALENEEEEYYNGSKFLLAKYAWKYDEYLGQLVVKDKGICLDKLEEGMPDFYG